MYGYNPNVSRPTGEFEVFDIATKTDKASVYMFQDISKGAEKLGRVGMGFDSEDKTVDSVFGLLTRDKLRTIRLRANYIHKNPGSITFMKPEPSQGLNVFGAKSDELSSRKTPNTFF